MIVAHQRAGARVANLLRELDLTGLRRWHLLLDPRLAAVQAHTDKRRRRN